MALAAPLELLFTVDEETGLGGALSLDASLLSGSRMLNLDTEEWNELYIGCAGGGGWQFERSLDTAAVGPERDCWAVSVKGLGGGHSGIQIHQQLGNAIKILGQFLGSVEGLQLATFDAGIAHNVIPREGEAVFTCPSGLEKDLQEALETLRVQSLSYLPEADSALEFSLTPGAAESALCVQDTVEVLDLMAVFPHGAQSYNLAQPADLVDSSINLAILRLNRGELFLQSSYRFFNELEVLPLKQSVNSLARVFDLAIIPVVGYPGWQPNFESALLREGISLHERLFGSTPAIKAIHAGLECGILKSKKPNTDILSFGPTIRGAHSPTERVKVDTVEPFWLLLTELLAQM
jgi:dipeptidase D